MKRCPKCLQQSLCGPENGFWDCNNPACGTVFRSAELAHLEMEQINKEIEDDVQTWPKDLSDLKAKE